jgi:hypothetical protein
MKYGKRLRWYNHFLAWLVGCYYWCKHKVTGSLLADRIADESSPERTEAQAAVDKVVMQTDIAPDCVSAIVQDGGPCILLKVDGEWEATIHNSFGEAADEAIKWLLIQGDFVETAGTSKMNRKQRRVFDAERRLKRGGKAGKVRRR